jgi:serine protease AprX
MNEILQLKGTFEPGKNSPMGPTNLPKNKSVTVEHLMDLKNDLMNVQKFWQNEKLQINPLVSVYYNTVVAKSNRIKGILESSSKKNNDTIVGAKFTDENKPKHIITHCLESYKLEAAIENLENVISVVQNYFGNVISHDTIEDINSKKYKKLFEDKTKIKVSRTRFVNTIVDAFYVEKFGVDQDVSDMNETAIVTIYETGTKTSEIMKQLDINFLDVRNIDETTLLLRPDQYRILISKAPYLISMAVTDISKLEKDTFYDSEDIITSIPHPGNEPTIGVIDTMFDETVYFSEWVEFKNMVDGIDLDSSDYDHGTMVSSIIVDGPNINKELDDGCGRFKVRHFGVAKSGSFSSFAVMRAIKEIVESNRDIKVWNLSLGSALEINSNFISPEASILDKIQYENDVIFVVAGTNKTSRFNTKKIGAPADSINSLVVNSVDFNGKPADYTREGLVLSFFNKPDVSYYGGTADHRIRVCTPLGEKFVCGTSFAAPWIARKLSYLIDVLGLTRELAKALIIDSAAGWNNEKYSPQKIGYGVVPKHINQIIETPDDEIKFMINGITLDYESNIPVPEDKEKFPFVAKATLCYFPKCSRNQGVDYTNTELDIHFGMLKKKKNGKIGINSINKNKQSEDERIILYEGQARKEYRKWDNVKLLRDELLTPTGKKKQPKSNNSNGLWGLSVKTKERLNEKDGYNMRFGVIVTLKEINGVNRIKDFIQLCQFNGWIVNKLDVENQINIYHIAEEEVIFD